MLGSNSLNSGRSRELTTFGEIVDKGFLHGCLKPVSVGKVVCL